METVDIVVVGAGLAGLSCARLLHTHGLQVRVVEAGDAVGGRVRTDRIDGFRLDRGFQVLSTAYPELAAQADLDRLSLCLFDRAMLLHADGSTWRLDDPRRRPAGSTSPRMTFRAPFPACRPRTRSSAASAWTVATCAVTTATPARSRARWCPGDGRQRRS